MAAMLEKPADGPDASQEPAEKATTARDDAVEARLRGVFRDLGLSAMAQRVAYNYAARSMAEASMERVRAWLLRRANRSRSLPADLNPWQRGCPDLVPGLRAQAFWDTAGLDWIARLEAAAPVIRKELLRLRSRGSGEETENEGPGEEGNADGSSSRPTRSAAFQPYRSPGVPGASGAEDGVGATGTDRGEWNVFYLFLHGMDDTFASNRAAMPATVAAIEATPLQYRHAFFSSLAPGTHITPHHGPTNKKLRLQLPLVVPPGACRLRVGDETRILEEGRAVLFDDSLEHEAWNDAEGSRLILIMDVWHPDLMPKEVKFFGYIQNASMKAARKAMAQLAAEAPTGTADGQCSASGKEAGEDFFSVITRGAGIESNFDAVWSGVG